MALSKVHERLLGGASASEITTLLKEAGVVKLGDRARILHDLQRSTDQRKVNPKAVACLRSALKT